MGATLAEKLIARGANKQRVKAGEIVFVAADRLMINDYAGLIVFSVMEQHGWENRMSPDKTLFAFDHCLPPFTVKAADQLALCRNKCRTYNISNVAEIGRHGIAHQLMIENFVQPGEIAVGVDSHSTTYGALGAFACGISSSDAAGLLASGKLWLKVPETTRIRIEGKLKHCVAAKDIALKIISVVDEEETAYKCLEIVGPAVSELSMDGRFTIANMLAETGAKNILFEADEKTCEYMGRHFDRLCSDEDAVFANELTVDLNELVPLMSFPSNAGNIHPTSNAKGRHVDQVLLGCCTNGRLEDLDQAVSLLRGKTVANGTRLIVVPASQKVYSAALAKGIIADLIDAGACVMTSSCASCFGCGPGLIGAGECCVSTTNRNFRGRMGSSDGEIYLASAYTAAAAALTGVITDPSTI